MNKKLLLLSLSVLILAPYQYTFAHGGAGRDTSYEFDQNDDAADREAAKIAAEKKKEQDSWAAFMKAADKPKNEKGGETSHDHHSEASGDQSLINTK